MTQEEYKKKKELALLAMDQYYNNDTSIMSDHEYDMLIRELRTYENENNINHRNSPTTIISTPIPKGSKKTKHIKRMYSMRDVFNKEELMNTRAPADTCFFTDLKYDGLSLNILYVNGQLVKGSTRGNGIVGEDITDNVLKIPNIPHNIELDGTTEIRGEVVLPKRNLVEVNNIRKSKNKDLFSNTRNAASGILRQKEDNDNLIPYLEFYVYGIGYTSNKKINSFRTHFDLIMFLRKQLGFKEIENSSKVVKSLEEVHNTYQKIISIRNSLEIGIDGLVYRVLDRELENKLGYNGKYPLFMWAYKFPAEEKESRLLDIEFNVGKSGKITPVALIEPVTIDGVTIRRVTLHNTEIIKNMDLKIGDSIGVIRSGDVIPVITTVYKDKRNNVSDIKYPTVCPICQHNLVDDKYLTCVNKDCGSRLISKLDQFISRNAFNIDALGEKMLLSLINNGSIYSVVDIFKLTSDSFQDIENCKEKKIQNILDGINRAKTISLPNFIYSLSIPGVGYTIAELISRELGHEWYRCKSSDYEKITGIGTILAADIEEHIASNLDIIEELKSICSIL